MMVEDQQKIFRMALAAGFLHDPHRQLWEISCTLPDQVDDPLSGCCTDCLIVYHDDLVPWDEFALWRTPCTGSRVESVALVVKAFMCARLKSQTIFNLWLSKALTKWTGSAVLLSISVSCELEYLKNISLGHMCTVCAMRAYCDIS